MLGIPLVALPFDARVSAVTLFDWIRKGIDTSFLQPEAIGLFKELINMIYIIEYNVLRLFSNVCSHKLQTV